MRIHPSGFYAWLKNPLSKRAREDARQTELIAKAWKESGKVYGYRKLHDDLLDQGCYNAAFQLEQGCPSCGWLAFSRAPAFASNYPPGIEL